MQFILFSLLFASQTAFADWKLNLTPGVTPISHDIYELHMTIFWICVVIGLVVFGALFYSIFHHRKSRGHSPAKFHEHLWVELTWTLIPFIILVIMAIPATRVLIHMNNTEKPDLTIKITGFQWKWKYEYLDQGISFFSNVVPKKINDPDYLRAVDHPLFVPIHKKIRLLITSNDVIHSWWVPDLGVKRDAIPGFINESWTRINRPGIYHGQCAELCGINHAYMPIVVVALAEKDFDTWIDHQKNPTPLVSATVPGKKYTLAEQMAHGEKIYMTLCSACHQPTGQGIPPTFPALKGSPIATGPLPAHFDRVLNGKSGTAMQAFKDQLNDDDLAAVITYERNAFGNNKGEVVQPEDIKAAR